MSDIDLGNLTFNIGKRRSFRYGSKWYPLMATVNHAKTIAGDMPHSNVDACQIELTKLLGLVRIDEVPFLNIFSVALTPQETIDEAKILVQNLNELL